VLSEGLAQFRGRRVLMLQGPMGPFFARLSHDLRAHGATPFKVDFNGGDWLFSRFGAFEQSFSYRGPAEQWPEYLDALVERLRIDTVLLFGDCRPLHRSVVARLAARGIRVGVFEEGYIRPDYITLEPEGVNSHSSLPVDPSFYLSQASPELPAARPLGRTFYFAMLWTILYAVAFDLGRPLFRHYAHHRPMSILQGLPWLRSAARKLRHAWRERGWLHVLRTQASGHYFLVPLQTSGDAQIQVHSSFESVPAFIEHVVESFSQHAPPETRLVIKHHPLDRGYSDYTRLIDELAKRNGLAGRCLYLHDQHLPTLLMHARGVVTINSTVGLSAIGEGVPVKACGQAIYDMPGLTSQDPLDLFWSQAQQSRPDPELHRAFRDYLVAHSQHQGSFYRRIPGVSARSGVVWATHGALAPHLSPAVFEETDVVQAEPAAA
jgi:capsular polysaccharide export protein